jgi:hypothetical protein
MKGKPSPPALIERLARLAPSLAGVEQRKMFGYPALFLNGAATSRQCAIMPRRRAVGRLNGR